ncbi:hypothetical protein SAMN05216215_1010141 [Saccharopolyspora shandongensis]|uniref:Uncharacterized protein n=1 Tax=Saccharopolyspora shandongensis TaxID=418495 RepID=A0A1H3BC32_9PSEU|nr:hypothetical protein SAMN05216215_1010141 [Saccharopolyspora shandongensis]
MYSRTFSERSSPNKRSNAPVFGGFVSISATLKGHGRRGRLRRTLIWNRRHLLHALREFEQFYNVATDFGNASTWSGS